MAILKGNEQELFSLVLPMFAQMRPLRGANGQYSALETITSYLDNAPHVINRTTYYRGQLRQVLIDFYELPRKWFCASNEFSYLTPVGLYAMRQQGIDYNEWDKRDKAIKYFIGKVLNYSHEITNQTGLAAPGVREVDFMILDIHDWDNIPESLGEEVVW